MIDCKIAGDYTNCKDEHSRGPPALSQGERDRLSLAELSQGVTHWG